MPAEVKDVKEESTNGKMPVDSPIMASFRLYAVELTARHDRHERLVRICRDVTTESKRIIFYLHSLKPDERSNLDLAENRIKALTDGLLKKAAAELKVGDHSAVPVPRVLQPAFEELSEAYCLLQFLKDPDSTQIVTWVDLQKLIFVKKDDEETVPYLSMRPMDFMLGVMDFTGELMRMCVSKASSQDYDACFTICKLLQHIHIGVLSVRYQKDIFKKFGTLKQSLQKAEDTCYKLKMRSLQL